MAVEVSFSPFARLLEARAMNLWKRLLAWFAFASPIEVRPAVPALPAGGPYRAIVLSPPPGEAPAPAVPLFTAKEALAISSKVTDVPDEIFGTMLARIRRLSNKGFTNGCVICNEAGSRTDAKKRLASLGFEVRDGSTPCAIHVDWSRKS